MENRNKLLKIGLPMILVAFFIPVLLIAQTGNTPEWQKNAVEWKQGAGILEPWFIDGILKNWKILIEVVVGDYILLGKSLAGAFTLIVFAGKSYEMMSGDKKWEIMPLFRPFGILMIIIYWGSFCDAITIPTRAIETSAKAKYEFFMKETDALNLELAEYKYAYVNALYKKSAETEVAASQSQNFLDKAIDNVASTIKDGFNEIVLPVVEMKERLSIGITLALSQILDLIALWILRFMVYGIMFVQIIYTCILKSLGPISAAFSVLPSFRDALSTWVARYFSVNLYVGLAYLVMAICNLLHQAAIRSEITKYAQMVDKAGTVTSMSHFMYFKTQGVMTFGSVIVTFLLTAFVITTVPTMSTWIVSTAGASSAVSTFSRAAQAVATKGMSLLKGK